jgi:hypothetical protein
MVSVWVFRLNVMAAHFYHSVGKNPENDPDEFNDLSGDPTYQRDMLEYASKMLSWRMEHDDPALTDLHLQRHEIVDGMQNK